MSRKELRERTIKAIDRLPDKSLEKLLGLLEQLEADASGSESDEQLIERLIMENREVLARLAQ